MVQIKSNRELEIMRRAGKLVAQVLKEVTRVVVPGMTLLELDQRAEKLTRDAGAIPAFKGYQGFKHTLCLSVNEQVVHGIPSQRVLKEGDIMGVDFGLVLQGFYGDSAVTVPVGKISDAARRLMVATRASLYAAIAMAREGNSLKDLARAVEQIVVPEGYGIVREFVGHGIGTKLHEEPQVANYEAGASPMKLRAGMTLAIEPMINEGTSAVKILDDRWTAVTLDGRLSAHYEHTIAVTHGDAEIFTEWEGSGLGTWDTSVPGPRTTKTELGERGLDPG